MLSSIIKTLEDKLDIQFEYCFVTQPIADRKAGVLISKYQVFGKYLF